MEDNKESAKTECRVCAAPSKKCGESKEKEMKRFCEREKEMKRFWRNGRRS